MGTEAPCDGGVATGEFERSRADRSFDSAGTPTARTNIGAVTDLGGGATGARRYGDEVHRSVGPWTESVHRLMRHARSQGVAEAPEVLGLDEKAHHERLRWIAGDEAGVDLREDSDLLQVGQLVRRVHDALSTFTAPADATWRLRVAGPTFIHGDISPWNVVWNRGRIVGLLDWDQAGPGRDLEDLAYAAWVWVPLEAPDAVPEHWMVRDASLAAQQRRLRLLADAYGASRKERSSLLSEIAYVQATAAGRVAVGAMSGDAGMNNIWWDGQRVGVFGAAMHWLTKSWEAFSSALSEPE